MDMGACNSVYYQYGRNMGEIQTWRPVLLYIYYIYIYNWLHHPYVQQGCTELTTISLCCMTKARLGSKES